MLTPAGAAAITPLKELEGLSEYQSSGWREEAGAGLDGGATTSPHHTPSFSLGVMVFTDKVNAVILPAKLESKH